MIVLVAGGRDLQDWAKASQALDYWHARLKIGTLVHAGQVSVDPAEHALPWAKRRKWGADHFAKRWAMAHAVPQIEDRIADDDRKRWGEMALSMHATRLLMRHKPQRVIALPGDVGDLLAQARRANIKCIEVA